jgi:hypothetical protein
MYCNVVRKAAENGFGPHLNRNFSPPPPGKGYKGTTQRASFARWPMVASVINTTSHSQITSDTTEKYENTEDIIQIINPKIFNNGEIYKIKDHKNKV